MKGQTVVRAFSVAILWLPQRGLMSQMNQEENVRNVVRVHGGFAQSYLTCSTSSTWVSPRTSSRVRGLA